MFTIRERGNLVVIQMRDEYAFGDEYKNSVSSQWTNALAAGDPSLIRFADPAPAGTHVDLHSVERIAMCVPARKGPALVSRDEREATFAVRCVAFKEAEQVKSDGALVYELDIVVLTRNESELDQFLSRPRRALYVRLEWWDEAFLTAIR